MNPMAQAMQMALAQRPGGMGGPPGGGPGMATPAMTPNQRTILLRQALQMVTQAMQMDPADPMADRLGQIAQQLQMIIAQGAAPVAPMGPDLGQEPPLGSNAGEKQAPPPAGQ